MQITGTQRVEIEITQEELGRAIMAHVATQLGIEDDAGCDWLTSRTTRNTYIGGTDWGVSSQEGIANLVDAANQLIRGKSLHVMPYDEK